MTNEETLLALEGELQRAGEDPKLRSRWERLEERRITPDTEIPPMEFLFELYRKPCFPRGELVAIAGKAKSGKTFLSSILMAGCLGKGTPFGPLKRRTWNPQTSCTTSITPDDEVPGRLHVMWFDTEQSEESTQDILRNRIVKMLVKTDESQESKTEGESNSSNHPFPTELFDIFNVRGVFWQERLPLLEAAIGKFRPDLVVLDGIRDLVDDINDGVKAQAVIERLMHMASERHCCIICILHQNKGQDDRAMRGWMGTELRNKAFEVYECRRSEEKIFSVKQTDTRKFVIPEALSFTVDSQGLPNPYGQQGAPTLPWNNTSASARPVFNRKYVIGDDEQGNMVLDLKLLFSDALPHGCQLGEQELMRRVMELANISSTNFYYSRLNMAVKDRLVLRSYDGFGRPIYAQA